MHKWISDGPHSHSNIAVYNKLCRKAKSKNINVMEAVGTFVVTHQPLMMISNALFNDGQNVK